MTDSSSLGAPQAATLGRASVRRLLPWAGVLAAVVGLAGWTGLATYRIVQAEREARAAQHLLQASAKRSPTLEDFATARLDPRLLEARSRLLRAKDILGSASVTPLRVLPLLGPQIRSLDALSVSTAAMIDAATAFSHDTQRAIAGYRSRGEVTVLLHRISASSAAARARLVSVDLGPRASLLGSLRHAREKLEERRQQLVTTVGTTKAVADALARSLAGHRRYVLVAANNAEMRAGSGMFLSSGLLTTEHGRFGVESMRPSYDRNPRQGTVALTGDLRDRWGFVLPNRDWRFLAMTPRFDASAELAARMWAAAGGGAVDGVVALDPLALRALLAATGPVQVGGRRVDAANVVPLLLHDEYVLFPRDERKQFLSDVAAAVGRAAATRRLDPVALLRELGPAAARRHLLVWSRDPQDEAAWRAARIDGGLAPSSLFLSVLNRGGNKLDPFLHVAAAVETRATGAITHVSVDVSLHNRTPRGEPKPVAGPSPYLDTVAGEYRGIFTLNLPRDATHAEIVGVKTFLVGGRDGPTQVVGIPIAIRPRARLLLHVSFDLPRHGVLTLEPSARYPPVRWRIGGRSVGDKRREIRW